MTLTKTSTAIANSKLQLRPNGFLTSYAVWSDSNTEAAINQSTSLGFPDFYYRQILFSYRIELELMGVKLIDIKQELIFSVCLKSVAF